MLKRIMIIGVLSVSMLITSLSLSNPARASVGHANNIALTESVASAENGDVPLPSVQVPVKQKAAEEIRKRPVLQAPRTETKASVLVFAVVKHKPWTPQHQAIWNMHHYYQKYWNVRRQFRCLNWLWIRESDWNRHATNPYSGAYGIPQALPPDKMAAYGKDWKNSSRIQIRWGLHYIWRTYGRPCNAWRHEVGYGWYVVNENVPNADFLGKMVVKMAKHLGLPKYTGQGCPYNWGGVGPCPNGFDCSGLVYDVFHHLHVYKIPRTANDQMNWAHLVKKLKPGDLVFYGSPGYASHVAIYIGHGNAIEALDFGTDVGIYTVDYPGTPIAYGRVHYHWNPKTKF